MLAQTHSPFPAEDPFLRQLHAKMEAHLFDSNLTVKKMLRLIGMSRTDLHRKLNRSAGVSATEYLRQLRLQWAAKLLLQHPEWSVYQVALEVGFNSQSYFTRRFRKLFGECPAAFRLRVASLEHSCERLEHA